jgi:hypothetical protein
MMLVPRVSFVLMAARGRSCRRKGAKRARSLGHLHQPAPDSNRFSKATVAECIATRRTLSWLARDFQ